MPTISAHGKILVANFRRSFHEQFGVPIRVYRGAALAADDATLASVRIDGHAGGREIELHGNMKVATAESVVLETVGIRVRVEDGRGELADGESTLGSLRSDSAAGAAASADASRARSSPTQNASPPSGRMIRFSAKGQMHCGTFCERFLAITGVHIRTYLGYSRRPSSLDQTLASARADDAPPAAAVELHGGLTVEQAEAAVGEAFGFAVQLVDADGALLSNGATLEALPWNPRLPSAAIRDVEVEVIDVIAETGGRRRSAGLARASAADQRVSVVLRWTAAVDLDLHAFGVMNDGSFHHVYFAGRGQADAAPFITLDRDMGVGRTAGDNREEIGVHRLREYRAILFAARIYNADAADNFARYDGKVDVSVGGETIRVPLTSSTPGTWAMICAVTTDGPEPEVISLNRIVSAEPTEVDVSRLVVGQAPPSRTTTSSAPSASAVFGRVADRGRSVAPEMTTRTSFATPEAGAGNSPRGGIISLIRVALSRPPAHPDTVPSGADSSPMASPRGVLVLVLGIVGWCLWPLAIAAIVMGIHDLAEMNQGRMDLSGRGMTLAGVITGVSILMLLLLYALFVIVAIVFFAP